MAKEIQRQADLKADYMLDTRSLRLEPFDSKLYLNAYDQSGVPALEPLEVNSIAHRQIGTHLKIPAAYYDKMLEEYPQLYRLYSCFLLDALKRHWEVKAAMYQYDAMDRYQWFLRAYPDLHRHVSGKHVASFLGMTQVTLSRLRRTLREAGQLQAAEEE